jgi:hypothetical protein
VNGLTALAAALLLLVSIAGSSAASAFGSKTLVLFAKATRVQYVNHADDRARAITSNPFNIDAASVGKLSGKENEKAKGPYPGDSARYAFTLYRDAGLKSRVGQAVYSCTFDFHHRALCEADFQLGRGSLFASGPADFDSPDFTLAVSGGTGSFFSARGQVSSTPTSKDAHRLDFLFG